MFDCSKDILAYHDDEVTLPHAERTNMRGRRDANRDRLKKGLKDKGKPAPREFARQGSYAMKTMVQHPDNDYDIDDGATKRYLLAHRDRHPEQFALGFGKRPGEELYDIQADIACLKNLAVDPAHAGTLAELGKRLTAELTAQQDPRVVGPYDIFDSYPRISEMRPELGGFAERGKYNPKYQAKP